MTSAIHTGDALAELRKLPDASVHCCVTSPPYYGLRDYGVAGQLGLEATPAEYVAALVDVFREVRRVLREDGTLWLNLGDSYAGSWGAQSREHAGKHAPNVSALSANQVKAAAIRESGTGSLARTPGLKAKDLVGIPWRVAFGLQADGWYLRSDCVWAKPNPMPESVRDRPTKAHEYVFLLAKSERYFFDQDAVREPLETDPRENYPERAHVIGRGNHASSTAPLGAPRRDNSGGFPLSGPGRNIRTVWSIATQPFGGAHFATMPPDLAERIKAGTSERGCCSECGAPMVRVVERPEVGDGRAERRDADATEGAGSTGKGQKWWDERVRQLAEATETWRASCDHDAPTKPCTVLDPFCGAGTALLVADRLQRNGVGIELNPAYAEMGRRRIIADAPLFNATTVSTAARHAETPNAPHAARHTDAQTEMEEEK